jgi:hypothetical protein
MRRVIINDMRKTFLYNQIGAVEDIVNMYTSGLHMTQDIAMLHHVRYNV